LSSAANETRQSASAPHASGPAQGRVFNTSAAINGKSKYAAHSALIDHDGKFQPTLGVAPQA
jgi:hypothetical protein